MGLVHQLHNGDEIEKVNIFGAYATGAQRYIPGNNEGMIQEREVTECEIGRMLTRTRGRL